MRFNHNAETFEEILRYFRNRQVQLYQDNAKILSLIPQEYGAVATIEYEKEVFVAHYLTPAFRGKGLYPEIMKDYSGTKVLTTYDCDVAFYLHKKNIKYKAIGNYSLEYHYIKGIYGNNRAERSKVYLMNHIDEGLAILNRIGASREAKAAYCLHPAVQSDEMLEQHHRDHRIAEGGAGILAMEYRRVVNAYLSHRDIKGDLKAIELSPLKDVNDMLIADKVQNRKDFELYHEAEHARSKELKEYFSNWLTRLGVSEDEYQAHKEHISYQF